MEREARLSRLTKWRRDLHMIPEGAFGEHKTREYLLSVLGGENPDRLETLAKTGVKCVFYGENRETAVAFRADMDALSIQEETGLDFASSHDGFMHACGHDGHMAMALETARYAAELRNAGKLPVSVVILFQPAEESVGGALPMIEDGALENPHIACVFGCHLMPDKPIGTISLRSGAMMASTCELNIEFSGKSAHGALPHMGRDAIAAACAFYSTAQAAIGRQIAPDEMALFSVGKFTAGDRRNIVADRALLEGIARSFSSETSEKLEEIIVRAAESAAGAFGVKAEFLPQMRYPAVINDDFCAREVMLLANEEDETFALQQPLMIAEDFSHFLNRRPGAYFFVGCGGGTQDYPLHSAKFNFDERSLLHGAAMQRKILGRFGELINQGIFR